MESAAHPSPPTSISIDPETCPLPGGGVGYQLHVHCDDGSSWLCVRRYSQFADLRQGLLQSCSWPSGRETLLSAPFPEKQWLGSSDLDTIRARRILLERWLNCAIALFPEPDPGILDFLAPDRRGAAHASATDAEDWIEKEKVRQLRAELLATPLRGAATETPPRQASAQQTTPGLSLPPEPEPEPQAPLPPTPGGLADTPSRLSATPDTLSSTGHEVPGADSDDDELLIREAAQLISEADDDDEMMGAMAMPPSLEHEIESLDSSRANSQPAAAQRKGFQQSIDSLQFATPPRDRGRAEGGTPGSWQAERTPDSTAGREEPALDAAQMQALLRKGGVASLRAVCDVLERAVALLDVPAAHTPRRRRRRLEGRAEQLLVRLRPAEGAASTQQWAHAAALMQLGPQVAAELSAQLVTLGALPSVGGEGMPVAGVQCLALALRTLEAATLGEGGRLLEQEVRRRLHGGGQEAVACAGAALAHCLEIVDTPLGGAPRQRRRALEQDVEKAQSALERGLGLKLAGRGLEKSVVDELVIGVVNVERLEADLDEEEGEDAEGKGGPGIAEAKIAAVEQLVRLLVEPDNPELRIARTEEARIARLREIRRREKRAADEVERARWGVEEGEELVAPSREPGQAEQAPHVEASAQKAAEEPVGSASAQSAEAARKEEEEYFAKAVQQRKSSRRRWPWVVVVVLLLGAVAAAAARRGALRGVVSAAGPLWARLRQAPAQIAGRLRRRGAAQ